MIEDTIARIEERLRTAPGLDPAKRAELEGLLTDLRREAASLPDNFRARDSSDDDVQSAVGKLEEAVAEFERTHPQLVGLVNRISTVLANMGI